MRFLLAVAGMLTLLVATAPRPAVQAFPSSPAHDHPPQNRQTETVPADSLRIVSLGGSITEIVYALGAGGQVVGVDASSLYPAAAQEKPDIGYFRRVPAEGILSLQPTLVLASADAGPPETFSQIRSAGVEAHLIEDEPTVEGTKAKIREIGRLLGREDRAAALITQMEEDLAEARALRETADGRPSVLFIYARGAGTMQVAGRNTSAGTMIRLAGGTNAVTAFDGFKPMSAESVAAAAPEVILMVDRGLESIGGVDGLLKQSGIGLTPAGENRRIVAMDDLLLLGFGPRLGTAVLELTRLLHPDVAGSTASTAQDR
jgi:iron complex transport system substrate-binding protein